MAKRQTTARVAKNTASPDASAFDKVTQIIGLMGEAGLAELDLESRGFKMKLRRHATPVMIPTVTNTPMPTIAPFVQPVPSSDPGVITATSNAGVITPPPAPKKAEPTYHHIVSPIAGTFYQAPSPNSPPFVKEGDTVTQGQTLCIIEAMKQMNEIKADGDGRVMKTLINNSTPVEKGTVLFWIEKKK